MTKDLSLFKYFLYLLPASSILLLIFLMKQPWVFHFDGMGLAFTLDLLVTVPFLYWLSIRESEIPKTTMVPVVFLCVLIGTWVMPEEHQEYLSVVKNWGLPMIELLVVAFIFLKVR